MNKDKVLSIRVKPPQYDELESRANAQDTKISKYVRKLIKEELDPDKKKAQGGDPELEKKFKDLQLKYKEVIKERDNLKSENKNLEEIIADLSNFKDSVFEQLLFLMGFFQKNAKLLQQHDRDYILEHREKFAIIAKQLEGKT